MTAPIVAHLESQSREFLGEIGAVLSEADKLVIAERIAAYNELVVRIYVGELGLDAALAAGVRSLNGFRTAAGVRIGDAWTQIATRIVAGVAAAALRVVTSVGGLA